MDMSLSKLWEIVTGKPGVLQSMGSQRVGHNLATEQQKVEQKPVPANISPSLQQTLHKNQPQSSAGDDRGLSTFLRLSDTRK